MTGMARWQLQEAKQQFSKLVERARSEGPQVVTRHGREVVVVLDAGEYERLRDGGKDFKRFLRDGARFDDLPLERSGEPPRTVVL
jgi:antitoxin Phd